MESHVASGTPSPQAGAGAADFVADRPLSERAATLLPDALPITIGDPSDPTVPFAVQRARDLLVLDVEARGMRLQTGGEGGPVLLVADGQGDNARLIVSFPPQHVGEQAWLESENPPPDLLAAARFARFSRLVYLVPAGERIAFSSDGVLAAMRRLELAVVPVAKPRPTPRPGKITDRIALPGGVTIGSSAIGAVLSTTAAKAAAVPKGVDAPLQASSALRTLRVRLDRTVALDIRPDAADVPIAAPVRAGERPLLGNDGLIVVGPGPIVSKSAKARAPHDDETAIEAPWRVIISPSALEGFTHADSPVGVADPVDALEPVTARERIELWHSRLGVRRVAKATGDDPPAVSIDERTDRQRIVRAIWARERELPAHPDASKPGPFRASLSPHERWQLVVQSAEDVKGADKKNIVPEPVTVKGLALSALGAWLDVHGAWDAGAYDAAPSSQGPAIKSWDHLAPMGRDQFVKIVTIGFLYPLGHAAVLVKQTERRIKTPLDPVARLFQRFYIVVAEPQRSHTVRDLPFINVRFLTLITPDLKDPAGASIFWPTQLTGGDVVFNVETIDHDGRHARLPMPLLFVAASKVLQASANVNDIDVVYRPDARAKVATDSQKIAFAPSMRPGDTSADVTSLRIDATLEGTAGVGPGRRLQPRLRAAEILPATSKHLTPQSEPFLANYHKTFKDVGFGDANAADLFLQVIDAAKLLDKPVPPPPPVGAPLPKVSFGSTERSGGFVDPAQQIAGLTRGLGTVGELDGAVSGTFDPAKLLGDALPKLFGLFKLTDLLGLLGIDEAPKFVTEALGPIQGLLADFAALQDAVQRAAAQAGAQQAAMEALAQELLDDLEALTDALTALLSPSAVAVAAEITTLLEAFTSTVDDLTTIVATLALPPLARTEFDKLLRSVRPYVADAAKIAAAVDQVLAFVQGLDPANLEVRAKLEWVVPIGNFPDSGDPIFQANAPLRISVESRAGVKTGASFDAVAELTDFQLNLVAPASLMELHFERLAFRAGTSGKPDVDVVFGEIEFVGPLSFIEVIKDLIPMDGFSDPPFLDVSTAGVRAGFTLGLPNVAVGVFALQNMSLGADCHVPFLGESVTVGFNFCTRERPFALTVSFIGGGGFFGLRISPQGLDVLELALEAGARLAIDLGVASGSIEAMLGIYMRLEGQGGSLTGYFRLRGEVDVLGIISASIELSLELTYDFGTGKMIGRATITIEVEVFMFSFSVSVSCERRFAGSNGDPTFAEVLALGPDGSSELWDDYCDAFA